MGRPRGSTASATTANVRTDLGIRATADAVVVKLVGGRPMADAVVVILVGGRPSADAAVVKLVGGPA
jgi:hypothetical protein